MKLLNTCVGLTGLVLLVACMSAEKAFATWEVDGNPICTATGNQFWPELVSDGTGGVIITWEDERGGNFDIYVQRVNAAGEPLWTPDGVCICDAAVNQWEPRLVSDGAGGAIIVWLDDRGGNLDIYVQRVNPAGETLWTPDGVCICDAADHQTKHEVISDGAGGVIIAWEDLRNGVDYDIYAQRVDSLGTAQWTEDGEAVCTAPGFQRAPELVSDGAGGVIITWTDMRSEWGDVYAQRLDGNGNIVGVSHSLINALRPALGQNIPNPFNPSTRITFSTEKPGRIALHVYDIAGRSIRELIERWSEPQHYEVTWNGRDDAGKELPSGVYFYRLEAGDFVATRKMVLIH